MADSDLRRALAKVPARMAIDRGGFAASFIGLRDMRGLGLDDPLKGMGQRLSLGSADPIKAFLHNTDKSWLDYTGMARSTISSFLYYGNPPSTVVLWHFDEPASVRPFLKGLESRGFSSAGGLWSNGEAMKFDLTKRDFKNPFLGLLGRASVLVPFDSGVAQSADPGHAAEAGSIIAKNSLADIPAVAAALDSIEAAVDKGYVPQAAVLTPAVWLPGIDTADLLDTVPNVDMRALAAKMAAKATQLSAPVSIGAIVADIETKEPARRGAIVALAYADCRTATQAGDFFVDKWKHAQDRAGKTPAARTGVDADATTAEDKDICVAVISVMGPAGTEPSNRVFRYILDAIMQRDFKALQGG